jgi:hypothetical protein
MKRALRIASATGAVVLVGLWTLVAVGAWWLLQAGASALDGQSAAATMQAVTAWTERPWVRQWLDPDEAAALLDGIDWLLGLGGGPSAWLAWALTLVGAALILVWGGGLLIGVLGLMLAWFVARRVVAWWRAGPRWPVAWRQGTLRGHEAGSAV